MEFRVAPHTQSFFCCFLLSSGSRYPLLASESECCFRGGEREKALSAALAYLDFEQ
ncbi:hypothetical protein CABS01_07542 [Colletotrichum abscissum]|uniref:uncharacterized protein n=1 Tax=Colletotrichum abscissum TaxID=1671311 RepID=UPI0027D66D1C|nr:uncharacterized protein CABS01_07542 [Colletotrichum abscissum]KAK1511584.1 hypothetical protein CABS01_07542 [Colletotrichum abscissum]